MNIRLSALRRFDSNSCFCLSSFWVVSLSCRDQQSTHNSKNLCLHRSCVCGNLKAYNSPARVERYCTSLWRTAALEITIFDLITLRYLERLPGKICNKVHGSKAYHTTVRNTLEWPTFCHQCQRLLVVSSLILLFLQLQPSLLQRLRSSIFGIQIINNLVNRTQFLLAAGTATGASLPAFLLICLSSFIW